MTRDFYLRFDIEGNIEDIKKKFVNRALNFFFSEFIFSSFLNDTERNNIKRRIASQLGERYSHYTSIDKYISGDFLKCLQAIEALYEYIFQNFHYYLNEIDKAIALFLNKSEIDLGIRWENGKFTRTGAKILDEKLINDPLRWLRNSKYITVLNPFKKGLRHLLEAEKNPALLSDVITDRYEAIESLAKIVVGNDKDLSANRESLIKQIEASEEYKVLLKDYITYANKFRHGSKEAMKKPILSVKEVESFVYLTGLFIRLAIP